MATFVQDYISNEDGDLAIVKGDFVLALSDNYHIENIFRANPGNYLRSPLVGIGDRVLNAQFTGTSFMETIITDQLQRDGYGIRDINVNGEPLPTNFSIDTLNINIDALRP